MMERGFEILCVSQFTLYHVMKGNKLDFHRAMPAAESEPFYNNLLTELRRLYKPEMIKGRRDETERHSAFLGIYIIDISNLFMMHSSRVYPSRFPSGELGSSSDASTRSAQKVDSNRAYPSVTAQAHSLPRKMFSLKFSLQRKENAV